MSQLLERVALKQYWQQGVCMTETKRYVIIHGHFYQPPRENPWLEIIEPEASATPYHDWDQRITDECYAANLAARILDEKGQIVAIVNNYSRLSFDFGPTLLTWMENNQPEVYASIISSDRENIAAYSGHGPALAQAYNHIIMPLARRQDKETQVVWGIADFRRRFGRQPEGMWLPETAVDLETLEIMADHDIKFTILSPHQATRFRPPGGTWIEAGRNFDTSRAYNCRLPKGKNITLFFYHESLSRGVAFEGLLHSGDSLAGRILETYVPPEGKNLVIIATDGETYGHHHKFGEMALAQAFDQLHKADVRVTTPGEYLSLFSPDHEVEIQENSAWSCNHGVERWRSGCCCNTGQHPGWNQDWRSPLRRAMDLLRDQLSDVYEKETSRLLQNPWAARDGYIEVFSNRSKENTNRFLNRWALRPLTSSEHITVLKLLEMERRVQSAFTSCGWFFDDIGGLESVLVLKQAAMALHFAAEISGESPESQFLELLADARSNVPALGSGKDIFEQQVRPLQTDLKRVGANVIINGLFSKQSLQSTYYIFRVNATNVKKSASGMLKTIIGRIEVTSTVTGESCRFRCAAYAWGVREVHAGVADDSTSTANLADLNAELLSGSTEADFSFRLSTLTKHFPGSIYGLTELFGDEKAAAVQNIVAVTLQRAEKAHRRLFNEYRDTVRFISDLGQPIPPHLSVSAAFILNRELQSELENRRPNLKTIQSTLNEMGLWGLPVDEQSVSYYFASRVEDLTIAYTDNPKDKEAHDIAEGLLKIAKVSGLELNLWRVQNAWFAKISESARVSGRNSPFNTDGRIHNHLGGLLGFKID
jgi:hypothetical protein